MTSNSLPSCCGPRVGDAHEKEICSLLNAAIRDDDTILSTPAASLTHRINALCLVARTNAHLPFPPEGEVYRGGGFDDTHIGFFTPGRQYRVPGFLATSFSRVTATRFLRTAEAYGQQAVMWVVHVDPSGEHDAAHRCAHVNYVSHTHVGGEAEFLFVPYSIFTVRSVTCVSGAHDSDLLDL